VSADPDDLLQIQVSGPGPRWLPPRKRPANESAGYLGYYCRMWLPEVFDLVDVDGSSPVVWHYWKAATRVHRMFEEKPDGQTLHGSQERTFRGLVRDKGIEVYVIHDADWLKIPLFPLRITRLGPFIGGDVTVSADRESFDRWMTAGLERQLFS
jgi:hypothetical protein